ncbi:MAG: glutamine amidotransferase-related protein [Christensenellales bacterium]|jgi:GMP synthase (glutamine-hydrolysing)
MARELIIILDFGDPSAMIAARMIRGAKVYCEIMPHDTPLDIIKAKEPRGIVAVGGAQNADDRKSPALSLGLLGLNIPVLAMGYAARALCMAEGGRLDGVAVESQVKDVPIPDLPLFEGVEAGARYIRRADRMLLPKGYDVISAVDGVVISMKHTEKEIYALQLIPEQNDMDSVRITANFAMGICGCSPGWTMKVFVDDAVEGIRALVGSGRALISMSGGVDSSVCAALAHRAIGDRLSCLFIDTGLMRENEPDGVKGLFKEQLGMDIILSDHSSSFYECLKGIKDSERKRAAINQQMQRVIAQEAIALGNIDFYVSGTIYRDLLYPQKSFSMTHQMLDSGGFTWVIEPLRELFKDEVRAVGELLGLPQEITKRQPFPEPGLAIRCLGEVTPAKLKPLREADAIFRQEIEGAGLAKSVWQYFAVLCDMPGGGAGDRYMVALRAVNTTDANRSSIVRLPYELLIKVMERITNEVPNIARVVYDLTGKPPGGVEWE